MSNAIRISFVVDIDDLDQAKNARLFSHDYIRRAYRAKQVINPRLLFVPTNYSLNQGFADRMSRCLDGVRLWSSAERADLQ